MKKISFFCALFLFSFSAQAKITIVACEPEWSSLAGEIVGNKARVLMLTKGTQNPAEVEVSEGLLRIVRPADFIFCSGGNLEKKWLERTINKSYNLKVYTNPEALLLASDYAITKFDAEEKAKKIQRRVHLNPHNITAIAAEFTRRIKLIDPLNANFYQKSYENFSVKWQKSIELWEKAAAPLKGMRVVISDDSWLELTSWLDLEIVGKIDVQKSYVKNNQRLNDLVRELKKAPAKAIIFANYEDKKSILWLSEKTETRVILLPFTVGGSANSADLFSLFATTINLLSVDCTKAVCPHLSISAETVKN